MEEYVLPSVAYQPLTDLISEPINSFKAPFSVDALTVIGDMTTLDHACVARNLVKIFLGQNCVLTFLDYITMKEMKRTSKIHHVSLPQNHYHTNDIQLNTLNCSRGDHWTLALMTFYETHEAKTPTLTSGTSPYSKYMVVPPP